MIQSVLELDPKKNRPNSEHTARKLLKNTNVFQFLLRCIFSRLLAPKKTPV
jgi:hypothetical protein